RRRGRRFPARQFAVRLLRRSGAITEGGPANSSNVAQYWAWQMSFQLYDFAKGATISVMMFVLVLVASVVYVRSTRHEVRG
ncbi:MAG TPA: hypothetical protein VL133_15740, partial [Devosia sp.]|nr:hypothetical protein [Devosia sp.]